MFGGRYGVSLPGSEDGSHRTLADFFSSKKSAPANRKKGFYTSRLPKNDEIRGIFVESSKELRTLFENSTKFKKFNHIAVNILL
jgi:hypothetical protein